MATDLNLSRMIGPLPLGGWVAAVGAGLFLLKKKRASSVDAAVNTSASGADPSVGDGSVGGFTDTTPVVSGGFTGAPAPTTNDDWGSTAVNDLIAGGYSPAVSDSAIRKYMNGDALSSQEYALVNTALGKLGAPPVLLPSPVFAPPTAPSPTTGTAGKPPATVTTKPKAVAPANKVRTYTVKPGDTLSKVGAKFHIPWQHIWNANKSKIKNPNVIHPGQVLVIPNA